MLICDQVKHELKRPLPFDHQEPTEEDLPAKKAALDEDLHELGNSGEV
jgi:hypothetical protein